MAVKLGLGFSSTDFEARVPPRSPIPSPGIGANDLNGLDDDSVTGYDFEFVPPLDNKYMCPICLLALRNPVQTGCGHRFCHLCILRCVRNHPRCPVDQTPLSPQHLFQDRSAQREVLDLKVKCSNEGCSAISELRNVQKHVEACPFRVVICKHKCGTTLLLKDVIQHEERLCPMRPVTCSVCGLNCPASSQQEHEEHCKQHQPVECPHCKHTLKRYKLKQHVSSECPQAPIHCVFEKVGCLRSYSRHEIQKHMETSTQTHLQYLLSTVVALRRQNDTLQANLQDAETKLKKLEEAESKYDHLNRDFAAPSTSRPAIDFDDYGSVNLYDGEPSLRDETITPETEVEADEIARIKARNKQMEECDAAGPSSFTMPHSSTSGTTECPCNAAACVKLLETKHSDHDQKIVSLDHHVRELMAKMDNQNALMKEINSKTSAIELRMEEQELRCCNGLYYWRIKEYTKLRKAASQGDMPVLHSPGFYTSPQGYKMCIRANLDGVDAAQGTHLSLFVHVMKGVYDDLLSWPFYGSITLTVINQRDLPSQRSHISETLEARSNLTAFRKPVTERNQKGYGYIDFFPLGMLENDGFIKANTLLIKAQVRVYDPPS